MRELKKLKLRELPDDVRKIVTEVLAEVIQLDDFRGSDGADGKSIRAEFGLGELNTTLFLKHADGDISERELRGTRGRRGRAGKEGPEGLQGFDGESGVDGRKGAQGRAGTTGDKGEPGPKGDKGETGDTPAHEWDETKLRFRTPSGAWGRKVNLKGDTGGRGASSRGGSAKEQFESIVLNGNILEFKKGGALGPDLAVDLSGLQTGGGIQGLGVWRYRTETVEPPSSGQVRFNNSTIASATVLWIHDVNSSGPTDVSTFLALLDVGDLLYIQNQGDSDSFVIVEVGSITDDGTYFELGINSIVEQGVAFTQNTSVAVVTTIAGGSVTVWGNITGSLSSQTDLQAELDRARSMRYFVGV